MVPADSLSTKRDLLIGPNCNCYLPIACRGRKGDRCAAARSCLQARCRQTARFADAPSAIASPRLPETQKGGERDRYQGNCQILSCVNIDHGLALLGCHKISLYGRKKELTSLSFRLSAFVLVAIYCILYFNNAFYRAVCTSSAWARAA